jgi:hypothetical protein
MEIARIDVDDAVAVEQQRRARLPWPIRVHAGNSP